MIWFNNIKCKWFGSVAPWLISSQGATLLLNMIKTVDINHKFPYKYHIH